MPVRRTHRILVLVAVGLLGAVPATADASTPPATVHSATVHSATVLERRATQQLAQIHLAQQVVVNPDEHLGHPSATDADGMACSERLAEAWRELGHFSDAYQTYLLNQPPCH